MFSVSCQVVVISSISLMNWLSPGPITRLTAVDARPLEEGRLIVLTVDSLVYAQDYLSDPPGKI
jgi:hypothetical protein